jgi:hypothetical protein
MRHPQPSLILILVWIHLSHISAAGSSWITTNAVRGSVVSDKSNGIYELTPSVDKDIPNSSKYYNNLTRLFLRSHESLVLGATVKATYGGKMVAGYDVRSAGSVDVSSMDRSEVRLVWETNHTVLKASYYRGRLYYPGTDANSDEWVTVFSSADREQLAVVPDSGPLYCSENGGFGWTEIPRVGEYELHLSTSARGSEIVAVVSLPQAASGVASTVHNMRTENWYSVARDPSGNEVVLTGGPSQSAPALSILRSDNGIVLSWPASVLGFYLQRSSDPVATEWADITNSVSVVNLQHQVTLPVSKGNEFFRLKRR